MKNILKLTALSLFLVACQQSGYKAKSSHKSGMHTHAHPEKSIVTHNNHVTSNVAGAAEAATRGREALLIRRDGNVTGTK